MRIGIFTDQYLPNMSGMVTSVINLRAGLEAIGHEVYVIAPSNRREHELDDHVIRVFSIDPRVFIDNPFAIPTRGIMKRLMNMHFDVVHVQEMFSIGALGHAVAKRTGVPLVYTVHTQWDKLYKHYPKSVIAAVIGVGTAFPLLFGIRNTLPVHLLEHGGESSMISRQFGRNLVIFANECDAVIAPSVHVLDKLRRYHCKSRLLHIPNSINLSKIEHSLALPVNDKKSVKFICVGRVSREKRQHVLIDAFGKLPIGTKAELFIIGDGPDLEPCVELAGTKRNAENIHFMGHVDNADVRQLVADADVLVLASYRFDNQPMVILEALAAGKGVLYCDDQLKDGLDSSNSLLVGHTAVGLKTGLLTLIDDPLFVKKLAAGSKKNARTFSTEHVSAQIANLYKELIRN